MKNTIIKKKISKAIVLFLFSVLSVINLNAQTITSIGTGNWSSASTWSGGIVPTAGNNVIINSTVYADGSMSCANLTVNAGAYLYNLYTGSVSVSGSVINNGSVQNNPGGYPLSLNIQGNITNNGVWSISSTTLTGASDQTLTEAAGMKFEGPISMTDSLGDVILGSDVTVNSNTWELAGSAIRTNGYKLISNAYNFNNGIIISNDTLILNNSYIDNIQYFGNYKLDGNVFSKSYSNVFNGTLTVLDTLANLYTSTILINGDVVNKGAIINNPGGYSLSLNIFGNVRNEGIWSVTTTSFIGTADQTIQQTSGKRFQGAINTTDSIGDIILGSDVMLESNTWEMNKSTLRTNGYKLISNAYNLNNGIIISNDTLILNNSYIDNIQYFGNYKLDGNVYSKSYSNTFNGTLTVLDTLANLYTSTIIVNGDVVNKGAIINNPGGYSLFLNIFGNVRNEGIWSVTTTNFMSATDQTIQQTSGKRFQGTINTTDSIGDIILESDVRLESSTWEMYKSTLRTNGYKLISNAYNLNNGIIISNDTLVLNNSYIDNMKYFGNYKLDGNVYSKSYSNTFNGTLTVLDTLANLYTSTIIVNGDVVNKGAIINNPGGYSLFLNIFGNVRNEGIWSVTTTNFMSATDQTIQQVPGKRFQGAINTTDSIGDIILESDVMLESSTWEMNKSILRTNGHKLISNAYNFNNGIIISNDTLVLNNSYIDNIQYFGNYKLDGNVYSKSYSNVFNDTLTVLDTIANLYTSTILINGDIINKGSVINNPGGYPLYLNIFGNVRNEGIWSVSATNFMSAADQTIQQVPGKKFEGPINTTDSIGDIILESDVMLESSTWEMNKSILRTNGYKLISNAYNFNNGIIISNDTLVLNNSYIDNMHYFGNYKLDGNVYSKNYSNIFNDTLTVLDTIANLYTSTILVNGDIINKGSIINNPGGYPLSLQVKGNLTNNHILAITNMYLIGTNPRTINGSNANGIQATIYADDSIRLAGNNTLPNIYFTANPKAWCIVDSNASLELKSISNPDRIINFGKVSLTQGFDNAVANTLSFYESSMNCSAGVSMNELTIDHYGYQQHPTATGTVNCWWRLRNSPQNFNDSLAWLKLNYKTDALNGNHDDSLLVFFSPNAGLDWHRITTGVSIDTATNIVTITNAPSYGHYLLASTPLGITTFHPMIETVEPESGGNTGYVTLYIFGAGLKNTSVVTLKLSGHSDIVADTSYITDAIGESMMARFNLANQDIGVYDVVVETPGDSTLIKPAYFTIAPGQRSDPWVSISGRDRFLLNRWQTFNLNYGNTANVDAVGTMLVYVVNDIPGLEVLFPDIEIVLPQGLVDLGTDYTRIADSVAIYYVTDSLTGYVGQSMRVYPFYIPYILAGSSTDIRVKVKLTGSGSLNMSAWMMDPFWENIDFSSKDADMPNEVRACITAAAMKMFAKGAIGLIPGASCYGLVDKIVDPIGAITPESMKPAKTWGSWIWNAASWAGNITKCATSFMPGIGQAVSLGIGITNMMINAGNGWDANEGCWRKFREKSKSKKDSRGVTSFDPNEIVGPDGFTLDNYITSEGNISYRIYFENKDTASASALEVFVNDTLDITKFDLSTFSFNTITFGDTTVAIQDYAKEFAILVDMFPTRDIIVQVHGALDTLTGVISWDFHSLDRITLELTEDPDLGFLPPNVNYPEGEGNVAFSCKLKETVVHDDVITNDASIVFDFNPPINTNTYSNTIDAMVPVSSVDVLTPTQADSVFTVSWSGNDQGCGILNYSIFVSENDSDYILWQASTNNTSAVFTGHNGNNYKFFCIASDSVGLTEAQKLTPEASTTITITTDIKETDKPVSEFQFYPNPASDDVMLDMDIASTRNVWVEVVDMRGRKMMTVNYNDLSFGKNQKIIRVDKLDNGVYDIILHTENNNVRHKLVIFR